MNNYEEVLENYKLWYEDLKDSVTFEKRRQAFINKHKNQGLTRVQIEPTQRCNYSCHMCPIDDLSSKQVKKDLSFEEFKVIIDQLPSSVTTICLSGLGEPFLNKDYIKMARYAKEKGYQIEIYNNGSLFKEEILEYIDNICFSVDSLTKELLQELRAGVKYDKLFDSIKKSVEYKKKKEIKVSINFTISNKNFKEIPLLFKACDELNIDYLQIQPISNNYDINSEKYINFAKFLKGNKFSNWLYIIKKFNKNFNFNLTVWYPRKLKGFCNWSFSSLYINKNLDAISCCRQVTNPLIFGNLKKEKLKNILKGNKLLNFKEAHLFDKNISICNNCPF